MKKRYCYLGVWIEIDRFHKIEKKTIKTEIEALCRKLYRKKITADHVIYIINRVIIPRILYRTQHISLEEDWCNNIMKSLYSRVKHAATLRRTTENNILFHEGLFNIDNLYNIWLGVALDLYIHAINHWTVIKSVTQIRTL